METNVVEEQAAPSQPEEKAWLTREEKVALVQQLEESGLSHEEFANQHNVSIWSLRNWIRKYGQKRKSREASSSTAQESYQKVKELRDSGMLLKDACAKVGISQALYQYWKAKMSKSGKALSERKYAPRQVKEAPVPEENFNKSVMAENVALRKLVVEQALDIQALKEAMGGRG